VLRPQTEPERPRSSGWSGRRIAGAVAVVAVIALPWSWFLVRDLSPMMDAVSVFLPAIALGLTIVALAMAAVWSRPYAAAAAISFLLFAGVAVAEPRTPQRSGPPDEPFRLVAANVFQDNPTPRDAVRAIADTDAQLVVTVEAQKAAFLDLVDLLAEDHQVGDREIGVFSVWPLRAPTAVADVPRASALRVEVLRPDAPFVVYAIHLSNPLHETTFAQQADVVRSVIQAARAEELPVVLAGDFNVGDRAESYRALHDAFRDAMRTTWATSTYDDGPWIVLQLRIDHVFVTQDVCSAGAKTFSVPGSDHDGLRVQLGLCR
jgi:endonuclease/exonuclease/phosphatase (EEP) superfamily protein YafD